MANTLLTSQEITFEALRIFHQESTFLKTINRGYDKRFAQSGAKIGDTLDIRLPNQYVVGDGKVITPQDTTEEKTSITITSQKHVALKFTSAELTLDMDNFSERVIKPAVTRLAAQVEADALNMYKDVYNQVANPGSAIASTSDLSNILSGNVKLGQNVVPTSDRCINFNLQDSADLLNANLGLFNPNSELSEQYRKGQIANRLLGFDSVFENSMMPRHESGSDANGYDVNGADQTGSTILVQNGTGTFKKGDVITFANVFMVHPETKNTINSLQQFTITADYAGGAGSIAISPAIVTSGATQNVSASPADGAAITKAGSVSQAYNISLGYHKDAFAFATADLVLPKGTDMAARENIDGISMRFISDFDTINDQMVSRLDILYGFKTIRPQAAVRFGFR